MKKLISVLSIAALVLVASPAAAHDNHRNNQREDSRRDQRVVEFNSKVRALLQRKDKDNNSENSRRVWAKADQKFVIVGTVTAKSDSSLVLDIERSFGHDEGDGSVTVNVTDSTKVWGEKHSSATLADVAVGSRIVAYGTEADNVLSLWGIKLIFVQKAAGTVTSVTDSTVTIQNSITGEAHTVTVDEDTKVAINAESATAADIQVGDAGWVKFKNKAGEFVAKFIALFR